MSAALHIVKAGPGLTLQDFGRQGYLANGLSRGGAMDPLALAEAAALMRLPAEDALAIEMAGAGGTFRAEGADLLIALTGAPMQATLDGARLAWPGSFVLPDGAELKIGGAVTGSYGYLGVAGLDAPRCLGARSTHLAAGIGARLTSGTRLDAVPAPNPGGLTLTAEDRFSGGTIRVLPSVQTDQFSKDARSRFEATAFRKDARASRMGARMAHDGEGFSQRDHLAILSEIIVPGDIQVIGDGAPFVLLPECQTMGGYPRIATVISADLARVAQAAPGTALSFRFVTLAEALQARAAAAQHRKGLAGAVTPRLRDPHDIPDLLAYQLVGGVVSAKAED